LLTNKQTDAVRTLPSPTCGGDTTSAWIVAFFGINGIVVF